MAFKPRTVPGSSGWMKPADHIEDVAIAIEVKALERARPTDHGPKDSAVCDVAYFRNQASLDKGEPDEIAKGQRIEQTKLAEALFSLGVGEATVVTLAQAQSKKGLNPSWIFKPVPRATEDKVVAWAEKRDTALAAALEDVPDFGDDEGDDD